MPPCFPILMARKLRSGKTGGVSGLPRQLYSAVFVTSAAALGDRDPLWRSWKTRSTQNRVPQGVLVRFRPGAPTRLFKPVRNCPQPSAQCSEALEKPAFLRTSAFVTVCSHPIPAGRFVGIFVGIVLVSREQTFTATSLFRRGN